MMSPSSELFFMLVILYIFANTADGLRCYECSNLQDKRCGTTFDFAKGSMEAKKKYLKTCEGELAFCRKIEYEDEFQGRETNGYVVSRSCWNSPGEEGYEPENKCSEVFRGQVCYCKSESCNGSGRIGASITVVLFGLLPFICKTIGL